MQMDGWMESTSLWEITASVTVVRKTIVIMNPDHGERKKKQRDVIDNKPQWKEVTVLRSGLDTGDILGFP